jgi:hypothetical protein
MLVFYCSIDQPFTWDILQEERTAGGRVIVQVLGVDCHLNRINRSHNMCRHHQATNSEFFVVNLLITRVLAQ